jgi:hypothetical protein
VLTFGGVGGILVRVKDSLATDESPGSNDSVAPQKPLTRPPAPPAITGNRTEFSKPIIAVAAAVLILVITGLALLIGHGSNSNGNSNSRTKKEQRQVNNENRDVEISNDAAADKADSNNASSNPTDTGVGTPELSTIETYASKVLTGISKDPHPVVSEKQLGVIHEQIQKYQGSPALQGQLQKIKRALPQVSAIARSNGLRPQLVVYAALAQMDRDDGRGDPAQVAAGLGPALARMRAVFGDELANDSLLTVAGLEEGAALQNRITRLSSRSNDSPTTIRSIWYLHDHQVITERTYDFVIRFMTLGIIAQDPKRFGLAADPLTF